MPHFKAAFFSLFVAAATAGCAGAPYAYFVADRTRGAREDAMPIATRNFVPTDSSCADLRVGSEARMFYDEPIAGLKVPTLHVRIYIRNGGLARFEMRPESFVASDDAGRTFPLSQAWQGRERTGIVLADAPARTKVDLFFRLPEGYEVERARAFRLFWGFRVDDEEVRHETSYERAPYRAFRDPFFEAPS